MSYTTNPSNYHEISRYISEYSEEVLRDIIIAKRCYIIDTCAVEFYKKENRINAFIELMKKTEGSLIIFRTILMEMCGDRGLVDELQIDFFKKLFDADVKVYVLYEEDVYRILTAYTTKQQVGEFFKFAVRCVKGPAGLLNGFLNKNAHLLHPIVSNGTAIDEAFVGSFWSELRQYKRHRDNMGEVACAICIHMLANMADINKYKYIFTTEDRPAISIIGKVINNQRDYGSSSNKEIVGVATSSKLVEEMHKKQILKTKEDIEVFFMPFDTTTRIKACVFEKFDVQAREKSFTVSEFAEFVAGDEGEIIC